MGLAKEKPLYATPTDYEDDFYQWSFEQAELLRQKRFAEADLPNLIEEIESRGNEQLHALESSYRLLISHLLKWAYQPQLRTSSWSITIIRERSHIFQREKRNPSLKGRAKAIVEDIYPAARREAVAETGLPRSAFPAECPWALEELRNADFMPD